MKLRHSLVALVAVGVIHFGCSSSDDNKDTTATGEKGTAEVPEGATGVTDKAWSETFASEDGEGGQFVNGLMDDVSGKNIGTDIADMGSVGTTLRAEDCQPTITAGSTTDADSDGIPDALTQTYNCDFSQEGSETTITGTVDVKDKDAASKAGGYKYTVTDFKFAIEFTAEGMSFSSSGTMNGTMEVTVDGNTFTVEQDSTSTTNSSGILGQAAVKTTNATKTKTVYEADEDGNEDPFDKGTIKSIAGTIHSKSEGTPAFEVTVGVKGADLVKGSCESGFESGSVSFIDGNGNETKATFGSDCTVTWTRNGAGI